MTPHYILHVGPHKTGSTYLQSMFTKYRDDLRAQGVHYPVDCGSIHGHYPLVELLRTQEISALGEHIKRFEATGAPTILLSSENFVFLDRPALRRLEDLIAPAQVTVVFYCRRPSEILLSGWRELTKHGVTFGLPEFVVRSLAGGSEMNAVNLSVPLARITGVFGMERLKLISYNMVMDRGEDLFQHFCATVLDWSAAPKPEMRNHLNRSLNMVDAEIIRMLNVLEIGRAGEAANNLFKRFLYHRSGVAPEELIKVMQKHVLDVEIDEGKPPFVGWHRTFVERFGIALTEPMGKNGPFEPIYSLLPYVRADYLVEVGMAEAMRTIHEKLLTLPEPSDAEFFSQYI